MNVLSQVLPAAIALCSSTVALHAQLCTNVFYDQRLRCTTPAGQSAATLSGSATPVHESRDAATNSPSPGLAHAAYSFTHDDSTLRFHLDTTFSMDTAGPQLGGSLDEATATPIRFTVDRVVTIRMVFRAENHGRSRTGAAYDLRNTSNGVRSHDAIDSNIGSGYTMTLDGVYGPGAYELTASTYATNTMPEGEPFTTSVYVDMIVTTVQCPSFTAAPAPARACRNDETIIPVGVAGGGPLEFTWQVRDPAGVWTDLSGTPVPVSCGTATGHAGEHGELHFQVRGCTEPGLHSDSVRCIVRNDCNPRGLFSQPVAITRCPADFNCDRFLDFFDFADFVDAFESGDPGADLDSDGFIDFFDFNTFIDAFQAGC